MIEGFLLFSEDPVAVLAHDGEAMEDDGLPAGEDRPESAGVELPREIEIHSHSECSPGL